MYTIGLLSDGSLGKIDAMTDGNTVIDLRSVNCSNRSCRVIYLLQVLSDSHLAILDAL